MEFGQTGEMIQRLGLIAVIFVCCCGASQPRPAPIVTRVDLADAYLRVERMLQQHPPAAKDRASVNRAMDTAAYHFFAGNYGSAVLGMNALSDRLRGADEPDVQSFVQSVRVRAAPRIAQKHRPSVFNVHFNQLYELPPPRPLAMTLQVRRDIDGGAVVFEQPVEFRADAPMPSISTKQPSAEPGRYRVELVAEDGQIFDVARWFVVERSPDIQRAANEKRLADLDTRDPRIFQAWVACRSRNALLADRPSEREPAQFFVDPIELAAEVNDEVEAIRRGEDPYVRRIGEYFRSFPAGAMYIPARVYAPRQAAEKGKPLPLVIALHGAGADESMFMEGYGAGKIRRLADEHGFLVVAPSTYWVLPNPSALEGLLAAIGADYEIDRDRVYVVGHSMGAMAAAGIATRHAEEIAGAVLIAGGKFSRSESVCPTLVIAAELDPLIPARDLQAAAEQARQAGEPVEFRVEPDAGHTLVVGDVLDDAIAWLLERRRDD